MIPLMLLVLFFPGKSIARDSVALQFFPDSSIFPTFFADALAHQLSISKILDNREWIGAIGVQVPVAGLSVSGMQLQVSPGATAFSTVIKTPGHITVKTIDYKVDFPVDVRMGNITTRIGYGHISAHYADDGIEQLGASSISAVKDYVALHLFYFDRFFPAGVYGGMVYSYHNEPELDKPWMLQWGIQSVSVPVADWIALYGAMDFKLKQEVGWGSTRSFQLGARLFTNGERGIRLAFTHRSGYEERGQLFRNSLKMNIFTLYVDV